MKAIVIGLLVYIGIILTACHSTGSDADYKEPHRPQIHFSPEANWMNDPNGLVYYDGEYHLFYQYFPDSTVWGPMHWGHAVSTDLLHWEHLPVALYPDSLGYIFSGSAVIDEQNTSGFKEGTHSPMVAVFTSHDIKGEKAGRNNFQTQGIAYSNDKGRTWIKYEGNPVIANDSSIRDFRDPKVFWHEDSKNWVLVLAAGDRVHIYNSPNLKEWKKTSEFGPRMGADGKPWECPDLFELPVDGNAEKKKWVMLVSLGNGAPNGGSGTEYFVGSFDGKTFKNDNPASTTLWVDEGTDNYAGVSWSNAPDNKRLFLGWMSNWGYAQTVPTEKWRSAMTLPRELSLITVGTHTRLVSKPVKEVEKLRKSPFSLSPQKAFESETPLNELLVEIDLSRTTAKELGVEVYNKKGESILIGYDVNTDQYFIDRTKAGKSSFSKVFGARHIAPRVSKSKTLKMRIFLDTSSAELFADDGTTVMTDIMFPNEDFKSIRLFQKEGAARFTKADGFELSGVW